MKIKNEEMTIKVAGNVVKCREMSGNNEMS